MTIESNERSLSGQVQQYILNLITAQELKPGINIPSENQLTEELGVSRPVVREAMRALSALGILDISRGKNPKIQIVNTFSLETIFNYMIVIQQVSPLNIQALQSMLDAQCAVLAARHGTEALHTQLRHLVAMMHNAKQRPFELTATLSTFHLTLNEIAENPFYSFLLKAIQISLEKHLQERIRQYHTQQNLHQLINTYQTLVDNICRGDAVKARDTVKQLYTSVINLSNSNI